MVRTNSIRLNGIAYSERVGSGTFRPCVPTPSSWQPASPADSASRTSCSPTSAGVPSSPGHCPRTSRRILSTRSWSSAQPRTRSALPGSQRNGHRASSRRSSEEAPGGATALRPVCVRKVALCGDPRRGPPAHRADHDRALRRGRRAPRGRDLRDSGHRHHQGGQRRPHLGHPDRSRLWAAQTPQVVRRRAWLDAAAAGDDDETDDAAMLARFGLETRRGGRRPENLKITRPLDLEIARLILRSSGTGP